MKQHLKIISVFLSAILVFLSLSTINALDFEFSKVTSTLKEEKVYSKATINQEFADNRVLVVMDKNWGSINKVHKKSFFGSVDIEEIIDLTKIEPTVNSRKDNIDQSYDSIETSLDHMVSRINNDNFHQILQINLPIKSKENVLEVIKKLEVLDGIIYVGPDYISGEPGAITNDTMYCNQWALNKIDVSQAWDITIGTSEVYVGIMDTGISNHVDLNVNLVNGWDFFNENAITNDDYNGHGTHVAGIIGAQTNNNQGIASVARNVSLVPLQIVNDKGSSYVSDVVEAITYATNNNIPIINHSWWRYNDDYSFKTAIANYPGLYVCIAGNAEQNIDITPDYPSSFKCSNIITVANTTSNDSSVDQNGNPNGSNYGATTVHLAAPGTNIYSCVPGDGYESWTGTSMAAPHVAGVAALIKSIRPELSATEIKELILNNVDPVASLSGKCVTGGRLNAYKAVRAATKPRTFSGDVNGDGRADIILSRNINSKRALTVYLGKSNGGFTEPITTQFTNEFVFSGHVFSGDFNGDGFTDIVYHYSGNDSKRRFLIYTSKGDGTFNNGVKMYSVRYHDPIEFPCTFDIADVNGDGKDDFIVNYRKNTNGYRYALVYQGTSTSPYLVDTTTNALESTDIYRSNEPIYTGDFNGDGFDDMVLHWVNNGKRQLRVYAGQSDGTFSFYTGVNLNSIRTHDPALYPTKNFISDVNGDGKDDFIVHWKNGSGKRNNLVYSGNTNSPYLIDATTPALTSINNYIETDPVFVGDINGDGRSDMVVHWASSEGKRQLLTYTANADGTYNAGYNYSTENTSKPSQYFDSYFIADVNGDGRDDFVVLWKSGLDTVRLYTYLGTTQGSFTSAVVNTHSTEIPFFNS